MTPTDDATITLELTKGGQAIVESTDGAAIVLRSCRPYPPGSPLEGELLGGPGLLRVKVRGSKRVDPEAPLPFRVEGRTVSLTREQRAFLLGRSS